MHSQFHRNIAALIAAPLVLSGCAQMTRHSNTMLFGTNTSLGLKVGTDATSVPSILVGYNRQEAVVLPLVANTGSVTTDKGQGKQSSVLVPCDVKAEVKIVKGEPAPEGNQALPTFVTHPCLLVASNDREGAKDSYSVLASFGANFGAAGQKDKVTAQGGLAQYFATGMAAQLLAVNGGASVVATGEAAERSAEQPKVTLGGLTPTADELKAVQSQRAAYGSWIDAVSIQMAKAQSPSDLKGQIDAFETALGQKRALDCSSLSVDDCAAKAVSQKWHLWDFNHTDAKKMNDSAKAGWPNFTLGG